MASRVRLLLALAIVLALGISAQAQIWNLSQYAASSTPPHEAVFDNSGQPWPFLLQINAADYDLGGQGIAYNAVQSSNPACQVTAHRADSINIKTSTASGAPFQIGCAAVGYYYKYTTSVSSTGPYVLNFHYANGDTTGSWNIFLDGQSIGTVTTAGTGDWDTTFATAQSPPFNLTGSAENPQNHIIELLAATGGANFGSPGDIGWIQGQIIGTVPIPGPVTTVNAARSPSQQWGLVLNYDMSTSSFATVSTWLAQIGTNSGFQWYHEGNCGQSSFNTAYSNFTMVADAAAGGNTVLNMHWPSTAYTGGTSCNTQNETYMSTQSIDRSSVTDWPSNNHYIEIMARMSLASPVKGAGSEMMGCAEYTSQRTLNGGGNVLGTERDICNTFEDSSSVPYFYQATRLWYLTGDGPNVQTGPPKDLSVYHKFGLRTTSNGTTDIQACYYLDGVQRLCASETPTSAPPFNVFAARQFLTMQLADTPNNLDEKIQYIRVWSCAAALTVTEQCNGPIVTAP